MYTFQRPETREIIIQSHVEIEPGATMDCATVSRFLFRAESAVAAGDTDYSAFTVEYAMVGQARQHTEPRPAAELLKRLRRSSDRFGLERPSDYFRTCQVGEAITLRVRNISDRPQRFAIRLVGKAVL